MDPQPPTAWLWLWSGGEGFLQEDLQPVQEVDMLLLGPDTRVEPVLQWMVCKKSLKTVLCLWDEEVATIVLNKEQMLMEIAIKYEERV